MCGLFGLLNGAKHRNASHAICKMLSDGLVVNTLRGADSVGLIQQDKKSIFTHRMLGDGLTFIRDNQSQIYIGDADTSLFTITHNRAATEGSVTLENCHPFEHMDDATLNYTVGVHNGTLTGWKHRASAKGFNVDSDWAISRINASGHDAFKEFYGAWAFVWTDDQDADVIKMARNRERPLYAVYVKDQNRMFFASEYLMLLWIADRNNVVLEDKVIDLTPGYIYKFNIDNPREFTREKYEAPAQTTTTVYNSEEYRTRQQTNYIGAIINLLKPAAKGKDKGEKHTAEAEPGKPPIVSLKEIQLARTFHVHREEVKFVMEAWDQKTGDLWGHTLLGKVNPVLYPCVIRRVNAELYNLWKTADFLSTEVIGADGPEGCMSDDDLSLILSRNIMLGYEGSTVTTTEVIENNDAGEAGVDAVNANLTSEIQEFFANRKKKENESQQIALGA